MTLELLELPELVRDARALDLGQRAPAAYLLSLAAGSRRTMAGALRLLALELGLELERVPWHRLRAAHVGAIRARLLGKLAPATCNKVLAALRGVLREAARLGLLSHEDLAAVLSVRGVKGSREMRGRALGAGELRALFASCSSSSSRIGARDAALLGVLYGCGLRRAEAAGLDLGDVTEREERLELLVRGKGNRERRAYLPRGAGEALRAWLEVRGREPGRLFVSVTKGGQLGRALTDHAIALAVQARARRAGVGAFSPHDLRRTLVGDLLDAGVDLSAVQAIAGHAQINTTARYDRRGERAKRGASDLVFVPFEAPRRPVDAPSELEAHPLEPPAGWRAAARRCGA